MKVVHIATQLTGGAGISAYRQHLALLKAGVDSIFITLKSIPNAIGVNEISIERDLKLRVLMKLGLFKSRHQLQNEIRKEISGPFEIYSLPTSDFRIESNRIFSEVDVVNLHWVPGIINYPSFFKYLNKPIVWTLHDMNPFLNGFHYKTDSFKYGNDVKEHEGRIARIKAKAYSQAKSLSIVAPSRWMLDHSRESDLLSGYPHYHIPYCIGANDFNFIGKETARRILGIDASYRYVLFVSENIHNTRKGYTLLSEALRICREDRESEVGQIIVGVNNFKAFESNERVIRTGLISDNIHMSLLYNAADLVVIPSIEDNLPNIMIESFSCGTPIVSFSNGGMKEFTSPERGVLIEKQSSLDLADAILHALNKEYNRPSIAAFAKSSFSELKLSTSYIDLYKSLIF